MPRLTKFTAREPEIEVRIDASPVLADFTRDPFDLAIREGRGAYPDTELLRLFELDYFPVASPTLARRLRRPDGSFDWSRARLLHEVSVDYWPDWIAMAGVKDVDVARGLFFSHTMLALDAAVEGQGVALAPPSLAERELARGALVTIDPRGFLPGTAIWLCWPRRGLRTLSPAATAFRDWVIDEAKVATADGARPRPRRAKSRSVRARGAPSSQ